MKRWIEFNRCNICGNTFLGEGHNIWPIASGVCCDKCNQLSVQRKIMLVKKKEKSK